MKLPVQSGALRGKARTGKCLVCGRAGVHEPNSFAFLNTGALKKTGRNSASMSPDLEGFFAMGVHGARGKGQEKRSAGVTVAEKAPLGQVEYYFCNTSCLRRFFNVCVDALEQKLAKGRP